MADEKTTKERVAVASLDALRPRNVMVEIERDEDVLVIPCRMLSFGEWQRIGYEVLDPEAPYLAGPKGKMYDFSDPQYLMKKQQAQDERMYRRLLAFIQVDVPGANVGEQIAHLRDTLEVGIVNKLTVAMMQVATEGRAQVEARAESFQRK